MRLVNNATIELIKSFESCRLKSYQDIGGVWTIGWGHTRTARPNMTITQDQADSLLADDIGGISILVEKITEPVLLTDNQFGALVSFTFNVGAGNLAQSTLLRLLQRGWYEQVPVQLLRWNRVKGQEIAGLSRRRKAEGKLWLTP